MKNIVIKSGSLSEMNGKRIGDQVQWKGRDVDESRAERNLEYCVK